MYNAIISLPFVRPASSAGKINHVCLSKIIPLCL
ncbi:hypothetical protein KPNJ1_03866 [Klebsiella pneumoniae 30660/NJST258_1]|nr:hypothetical protein KPNJ1_03866 [Klebsiella pneumoniae 30660/NJST258_1]